MTQHPTPNTRHLTPDTLPDFLKRRADLSPDKSAVITGTARLTFADLYQKSLEIAANLAESGIKSGDKVALLADNSLGFVALFHAVSQLGAVLVPLNTRLAPSEISWQVQDVEAKILVYDEPYAAMVSLISQELTALRYFQLSQLVEIEYPAITPNESVSLEAVHTIIYSSGTTGKPKGVMLTYGNHWWSATASALNLGNHADDCWLAVLPLFHVGGMSILWRSVIYGIPAMVHESFDPQAVNRAIDEQGVTIVSVVANMLQRMLDTRNDRPYPPTLRCVLVGGGPVPQPLLERCAKLNIPVLQTYGMTETASQVATLAPELALAKLGSAGKPLFPTELKIRQDGQMLKSGEVGEIVVRGAVVSPGYYKREAETQKAWQGGWFHTGDLGKLDRDGFLYVVDRRTDLIISGGENVYPAEIEAVLLAHPAVEEAGVFARADVKWGHVPVAALKLREGMTATETELIEWCQDRLARYKVPRSIEFRESLPRNAAGKLVRRLL
jgi:o-succinylbenzoate---CoA ligase